MTELTSVPFKASLIAHNFLATPNAEIPKAYFYPLFLEMRQFLKGIDISQSVMEVKVLYPSLRKYGNSFQIQSER